MSAKWRPPTPDNRRRPSRRRQPNSAQLTDLLFDDLHADDLHADEFHADELHAEVQAPSAPLLGELSQSEPVVAAQEPEKSPARRSRRGGTRARKPSAEADPQPDLIGLIAANTELPVSESDGLASAESAPQTPRQRGSWRAGRPLPSIAESAPAAQSMPVPESSLLDPSASDLGAEPAEAALALAPDAEAARPTPRARKRTDVDASPVEVTVGVPRGMSRRVDAKLVRQVAQHALQADGWTVEATLDIHIITDEEMREVNATRRGIDEVTDVLSFPLIELQPGGTRQRDVWVLPPDTPEHLGDVVISVERVEAQAEEGGHSKERELAYLTAHGVLHILGYDHETDEQRRTMRRREEEVLVQLGLRRNG